MMLVHWICAALVLLLSGAPAPAGDVTPLPSAQDDTTTQTRACSSCTARHQALLRKKKQREKKALEDAAKANSKTKE